MNLFIFLLILAIDLATKYFIRLFGGFYICNKGISWGIILPESFFWIFWLISATIILLLFFKTEKMAKTSLVFILGGSVANIIERLWNGCVSDFLTFPLISFPAFNVADIAITIGSLIFLYFIFFQKRPSCV